MTYNLASFTWTGWDEPGIDVAPSDQAAGLAAARSNLDMAVELGKGDLAISRGWWMLGAHLLTAGDHAEACEAFSAAAEYADQAGSEVEAELSRAFDALASVARGDDGAETELSESLARLQGMDGGRGLRGPGRDLPVGSGHLTHRPADVHGRTTSASDIVDEMSGSEGTGHVPHERRGSSSALRGSVPRLPIPGLAWGPA